MLSVIAQHRRACILAGALASFGLAGAAQARPFSYTALLNGPSESPVNASPGTGLATVDYDGFAHTLHVHVDFTGLTGQTTASHIHSATAVPFTGTAGVATQLPSFVGFPLGVTSGTFDNTFDLTLPASWNPAFVTAHGGTPAGAEAFLHASLDNGTSYLNIHTSTFGGGEIRGFLIPGPGTGLLLGLGGLAAARRRR